MVQVDEDPGMASPAEVCPMTSIPVVDQVTMVYVQGDDRYQA